MSLPVDISPEAAEHIRQRGGALTLRAAPRHGCCGGTVEMPVVETSRPASGEFVREERGEVTLFVEARLAEALTEPVHVGLDRLLGLEKLYVTGAPARM
jgi:hypothetical protein